MTAADGAIGAVTKVVDNGPAAKRWNLVILGDGYQASELDKYHTDVKAIVDTFQNTKPFDDLWSSINVFRIDVTSHESGADKPAHCGDDPAPNPGDPPRVGVAKATFFDATFCFDGKTRRLLCGASDRAKAAAKAAVPQVTFALVVVNDGDYGGSGGDVAWCSTHPSSTEIALHEMGHTAFALADEYGDTLGHYPGHVEPAQANVTHDSNPLTTKWHGLIVPGTPASVLPFANPDCSKENPAVVSPVAKGVVGLFEGGSRYHCGLYHPEFNCRMRTLGEAFCSVCQQKIRDDILHAP